ncbi:hypothetical protein [Acinetobacter sp. ANC 4640]
MWQCLPKEQLFCLMSSFSIIEASALIAGHPPSDWRENVDWNHGPDGTFYLENASDHEKTVFDVAVSSITHDIEIGELNAVIKTNSYMQLFKTDTQENWQAKATLDVFQTRIRRDDLVNWLKSRHCYPDFFFNNSNTPEHLKRDNYYAPKLASLMEAWKETKQAHAESRLNGTVKQHAEKWLKENAKTYGIDSLKNFNELAAVVNFEPDGGRKPTSEKDKPTPSNLNDEYYMKNNDEKINIQNDLIIQKNDLPDNPYNSFNFKSTVNSDDDIPF